ncbi:hypothetical protein BU25DRAFT_409142 [Macroventuria anomochaeta]|uniref:Uncharacterized protein n=1 Tax=Macroventuria anomochaeta TaxID=301207 RepID=A0ACB6S5C0_9PLEO|nr:uncharacterized protein BU25DRAFT_409142 [Macroventuria anomochaeta]KAF2629239.1 hypothetical protein BU25DRAFT_409142 [Macroventuria anomochaeta]
MGHDIVNFQVAFRRAFAGRFYALTKKGYIGLVPYATTSEARVATMPGGKGPYILSQVPSTVLMHEEGWDGNRLATIVVV